ncbi:hypothetical protein EQO05_05555 [Methanosarcina sp. MSH10X1]|uniref:hypothetical protein n=1 Tax=Methanosarcina sp. MSH10X1 TaxID=2507075 RepID=UPI000FFBFD46|nr:hypothetical protein [Methanosarcina sp. MSH10X1]RXA20581.1 hypothetical protein EQO05_05555 [Methanosarcina sp. MSH10X1]
MDTSEKCIKMCELAKEIQRKWVFRPSDFVYDPASEEVEVSLHPGNNLINCNGKLINVWKSKEF